MTASALLAALLLVVGVAHHRVRSRCRDLEAELSAARERVARLETAAAMLRPKERPVPWTIDPRVNAIGGRA